MLTYPPVLPVHYLNYFQLFRFNCDNQGSNPAFDKSEMLRLWKGLHYCFWMSDKPLIQEELADKIASLMHCIKVWHKYYTNPQLYINASFSWLSQRICIFIILEWRWQCSSLYAMLSDHSWQRMDWHWQTPNGQGMY